MTYEEFKNEIFRLALENGCSAAELYGVEGSAFDVNALGGEIERYSTNRSKGCNLRVKLDGKDGYAYTEYFDDAPALLARAMDNAKAIEVNDEHPMFAGAEYKQLDEVDNPVLAMTEREKIDMALELERRALAYDNRVERVNYCTIGVQKSTLRIDNTLGLHAKEDSNISYALLGVVMHEGDEHKDGYELAIGAKTSELDDIVKGAVKKTEEQFRSHSIASGKYKILLKNETMVDLLTAFFPIFSADFAQKGLSLLKDKEGEKIASDAVTLIDDPFYGEFKSAFDAEGVPTFCKPVIENGVFKTMLHNLKTAAKAGVTTTANAGRPSVASPIKISASNLFFKPGDASFEEMQGKLGDGLIITSLEGLHSGVSAISGDFSLIAKGLLVKGGKVVRPVDQITIAGSFLTLMREIMCFGSDIKFGEPSAYGMIGAPSVLISSLMVSGKE